MRSSCSARAFVRFKAAAPTGLDYYLTSWSNPGLRQVARVTSSLLSVVVERVCFISIITHEGGLLLRDPCVGKARRVRSPPLRNMSAASASAAAGAGAASAAGSAKGASAGTVFVKRVGAPAISKVGIVAGDHVCDLTARAASSLEWRVGAEMVKLFRVPRKDVLKIQLDETKEGAVLISKHLCPATFTLVQAGIVDGSCLLARLPDAPAAAAPSEYLRLRDCVSALARVDIGPWRALQALAASRRAASFSQCTPLWALTRILSLPLLPVSLAHARARSLASCGCHTPQLI